MRMLRAAGYMILAVLMFIIFVAAYILLLGIFLGFLPAIPVILGAIFCA